MFYQVVECIFSFYQAQALTTAHDPVLDQVYGAIADPTRRAILAVLAAGGEETVGDLAQRFPISFNGVSKHVKVLERAGLVRRRVRGREHWLRLRPKPLQDAARWLEHYRAFWDTRLDALEAFLDRQKGRPVAHGGRRGGKSAT
jgi:DNA-binding transcriptional ArsR family regulator